MCPAVPQSTCVLLPLGNKTTLFACSVIMEMGPVNIPPSPAGVTLALSEEALEGHGGGGGFPSWPQCAPLARPLRCHCPRLRVQQQPPGQPTSTVGTPAPAQEVSWRRLPSESTTTPFLEGSLPENSTSSSPAGLCLLAQPANCGPALTRDNWANFPTTCGLQPHSSHEVWGGFTPSKFILSLD